MASLVSAEVSVKFSNYTLLPTTTNEVYAITLLFIVDGTGNVVLDASTAGAHQILRDAVNAWDGPVGTISYAGAFNTTFLLEIRSWGGVGLNLSCHEGGGLGVGLRSAWRIDRPGFEYIAATAAMGAGVLEFRSVSWNYRSKLDAHMVLACPLGSVTNSLPSRAGTWTLSDQGIRIGDNQTLRFENVFPGEDASGYALAGFSFDVVDAGGGFSGTADLIRNSGVPEGFPVATPKGRE
jgi:hypothetical protein